MMIRKFVAAIAILALFGSPAAFAQDTATTNAEDEAAAAVIAPQVMAPEASSEIKALTDIILRSHIETLTELNYWNATELYFSQRQDIDLTRAQLDILREELRPIIGPTYDEVMPPVHNLMAAIFSDSEAAELTKSIEADGVQGAVQTPLGQLFAAQAMPAIDQALNSLVFDDVFSRLPVYREAAINKAIELEFLSANIADESEAEFDVSAPEAEPATN